MVSWMHCVSHLKAPMDVLRLVEDKCWPPPSDPMLLGDGCHEDTHNLAAPHTQGGTEDVPAALQRSELFPNELQPWRRPLAYYYLHAQLTAPWEAHSLLAEAPAASTTGLYLGLSNLFTLLAML